MGSTTFSDDDRRYMRRALALAKRGQGRVEPNPMVGCVLVKADRVVAEGHHERFGGPHAEARALRKAGASARGATAYVSLEPCAHFGKTPPCADALIEAGVKTVVVGMKDPFSEVAGRGIRRLRCAGVDVRVGCLAGDCKRLNAPYLTRLGCGRPYVILKWAQSLDGQLVTPKGHSPQISAAKARAWVHRLRARVDAIIVGANTVRDDDPKLTARAVSLRRTATRIVLDTKLRTRMDCAIVRTAHETPTLFVTARSAPVNKRRTLVRAGVDIVTCPIRHGRVDLRNAVNRLVERGMTNVLVEGGPTVLSAFLKCDLADEVCVFVAPRILGPVAAPVAFDRESASRYTVEMAPFGGDVLCHAHRHPPAYRDACST